MEQEQKATFTAKEGIVGTGGERLALSGRTPADSAADPAGGLEGDPAADFAGKFVADPAGAALLDGAKNRIEWLGLEAAAAAERETPAWLRSALGGLASPEAVSGDTLAAGERGEDCGLAGMRVGGEGSMKEGEAGQVIRQMGGPGDEAEARDTPEGGELTSPEEGGGEDCDRCEGGVWSGGRPFRVTRWLLWRGRWWLWQKRGWGQWSPLRRCLERLQMVFGAAGGAAATNAYSPGGSISRRQR
jgi:hypothetical protein